MTSESGGAAFNPAVITEDHAPEPDDPGPAEHDEELADDGRSDGEEQG